jgi:hypothetical protein
MNKLTKHELSKRLDAEFDDVDLSIHDSPTKGTVAVVYFYEDKLNESNETWESLAEQGHSPKMIESILAKQENL